MEAKDNITRLQVQVEEEEEEVKYVDSPDSSSVRNPFHCVLEKSSIKSIAQWDHNVSLWIDCIRIPQGALEIDSSEVLIQ